MIKKFRLKNNIVVLTGACGIIGSQFAKALVSEGALVVAIDIRIKNKIINKNIKYFKVDLKDENSVKNLSNQIIKKYKKINVLINCAFKNPVPSQNKNKKKDIFNIQNLKEDLLDNFITTLICIKHFGDKIKKNIDGGSIINLSSDLGIISPDQRLYKHMNYIKPISYSISKHGIIGLTKYIATLWAKNKVRCNAIAPGGVFDGQNKIFIKKLTNLIPLGRMAKKNEYNELMLFLASRESSYITGTTIVADGGRTIW